MAENGTEPFVGDWIVDTTLVVRPVGGDFKLGPLKRRRRVPANVADWIRALRCVTGQCSPVRNPCPVLINCDNLHVRRERF